MTDADVYQQTLSDTIALHERIKGNPRPVLDAVAAIVQSLRQGGKVLFFGNGGSAAEAQHMAAELVSRFARERRALAAMALTTDTSILTAVANDYAFDRVFARQVEGLGRAGDIAIGLSTSGRSPNVIEAFKAARTLGLKTIALTGRDGGDVGRTADIHINIPSDSTPRAQECHLTLLHIICDLVEAASIT